MDETKLKAIEAWATQAIAEYSAEIATGEPEYPQMAADVLELVRLHSALIKHNEMQAALLRRTVNQPKQACPDCFGSGKETCQPEEPCNLCGGKGVV